jgi:type I restriction enzyme, S subunit
MENSNKVLLGQICKITDCEHKTAPNQDLGIPLIRTPNIGRGNLILGNVKRVSEEIFELWSRRGKPQPGDLIMAREAPVGNVAIVPKDLQVCLGQRTVLLRPDSKQVDSRYLNYLLNSNSVNSFLLSLSNGATVGHLNVGDIRKLTLPKLPSLSIQNKISAVLSTYDDLIENNDRRITLLEKMAEEIYREWFVRLHFPGHEQITFHKGIPEGWEVKRLSELVTTQYGYTASAEDQEIGPKFLRITDIVPNILDWENVPYCRVSDTEIKKYLLCQGDIVVARTGATVGYAKRIHKSHPASVFASYLVRLKPKNSWDSIFLGIAIESNSFKNFISMFFTGSAQPQANAQVMTFFPLLYPTKHLIVKFNNFIEPILDQKEALYLKNSKLKQTRDRLLTRLISGKLSIEDLDIQFPPSMTEDWRPSKHE